MLELSQIYMQKLADKAKLFKNFKAICAHCNNDLEVFPIRSATCSACLKKSFVEMNPIYNRQVLVTKEQKNIIKLLASENAKIYEACRLKGYALDKNFIEHVVQDDYWQHLNEKLLDTSESDENLLNTLYQMFLLSCYEQHHISAFERLPAILSVEFGKNVRERLDTSQEAVFLSYGRTIFRPYDLQQLIHKDDLPLLKHLLTEPKYKNRYKYFFERANFDGDLIWQCINAEYNGKTDFFECLHTQIINPTTISTPSQSLFSKIKHKLFK